MSLTIEEVDHIAELARLRLTDGEKARYQRQLSAILGYAACLKELDTSEIPPTSSVLPSRTVLRTDEPRAGIAIEDLFHNAPQVDADQFRVPLILE